MWYESSLDPGRNLVQYHRMTLINWPLCRQSNLVRFRSLGLGLEVLQECFLIRSVLSCSITQHHSGVEGRSVTATLASAQI